MKMIIAIVNNDDSSSVVRALTKAGFYSTKLATTGGFLMAGNTTLLIGVDDKDVDAAIEVITAHSKKRKQTMPTATGYGMNMYSAMPVEVTVGGATVFVIDVEQFKKV